METKQLTYIPDFGDETLSKAIIRECAEAASDSNDQIHGTSGRPLAKKPGYPDPLPETMPPGVVRPFAGMGILFGLEPIGPRESVPDTECSGESNLSAARINCSTKGNLVGLDFTGEMIHKARKM